MKYIFPRQFGLHNAFTSTVDRRETIQSFKDYTLREQEIAQMKCHSLSKNERDPSIPNDQHLPRRLRGKTMSLVKKLQLFHRRCSYTELLKRYSQANVRECLPLVNQC